jgi:hypothetical protein
MARFVVTGTAALALAIVPTVLGDQASAEQTAQPCYNGVLPWGPYVPSCTLPGPQGAKIRGSAPDANAIIACRHHPGCLPYYINGP